MYSSEHGPNNDDEINIIEKGKNYGWPNVEGFCDGPAEQSFCSANNVKRTGKRTGHLLRLFPVLIIITAT